MKPIKIATSPLTNTIRIPSNEGKAMKHLLTSIKHEIQDCLRSWEQSNPELLEFAIRLALCIGTGIIGGIIVGAVFWSAQIGFGWAVALACVMMLFVKDQ